MKIQANCFISTIIPESVLIIRLAKVVHKSLLFLTVLLGALGGPTARQATGLEHALVSFSRNSHSLGCCSLNYGWSQVPTSEV